MEVRNGCGTLFPFAGSAIAPDAVPATVAPLLVRVVQLSIIASYFARISVKNEADVKVTMICSNILRGQLAVGGGGCVVSNISTTNGVYLESHTLLCSSSEACCN